MLDEIHYQRMSLAFSLIKNPELLENYINYFKDIENAIINSDIHLGAKANVNGKAVSDKVTHFFFNSAKEMNDNGIIVTLDELTNFQKNVNIISGISDKIINHSIDLSKVKQFIDISILNDLTSYIVAMQMGVNYISASLGQIYQIDKNDVGIITDIKDLASFTKECIKYAIPSKYIIHNLIIIADENIRGNVDFNKLKFGMSRVVLLPKDKPDIVYKIAFNGLGIKANKTEYSVYQYLIKENNPIISRFAATNDSYDNIINVQERVKMIPTVKALGLFIPIANEINDALNTSTFRVEDINYAGLGITKKKDTTLVDYGTITLLQKGMFTLGIPNF